MRSESEDAQSPTTDSQKPSTGTPRRLLGLGLAWLLGCAGALPGCGHAGQAFRLQPPSDATGAVVYLYRPSHFAASLRSPGVLVDDRRVCDIRNGGYCRLELAPGQHRLRVETDSQFNRGVANVQVEAGKSYFLAYDIEPTVKVSASSLLGGGLVAALLDAPDGEQKEKLILEEKTEEQALSSIRETECANCTAPGK